MKKRKRYHIVIVREDGKQYHNRVLNWFQMRRSITVLSSIAGGLLLGTIGFFIMATWHGNLIVSNMRLLRKEHRLRTSIEKLSERLEQTRGQLGQSERELSKIESLAREQNLKVPQPVAGAGGAAREGIPPEELKISSKNPKLLQIADSLKDLSGQANLVQKQTKDLSSVLIPHLEGLARTPSIWPAKGFLTSRYGDRQDPIDGMPAHHEGIDISAPSGSPVVATAEGIVVFTGWRTGYGNCVEISHGRGTMTRFGHLSQMTVRPGQTVKRWQKIGAVGCTGRCTGSHLHYEIRIQDQAVNPSKYLAF